MDISRSGDLSVTQSSQENWFVFPAVLRVFFRTNCAQHDCLMCCGSTCHGWRSVEGEGLQHCLAPHQFYLFQAQESRAIIVFDDATAVKNVVRHKKHKIENHLVGVLYR